ncbi:hypothetical protein MBLNU457_6554t1 [Dothideomycetes sp. NU457]
MESHTPVIIGIGDVVNRSTRIEDALEPLELMLQAIQKAISDACDQSQHEKKLQSAIDSVDVVATWTWPYPDLPSLIAERLGVAPRHKHYSAHGGNQPGKLFDEAARRISLGETKVAVLTGGEALASLSACAQAKKLPPPGWTDIGTKVDSVFSPTTRSLGGESIGAAHSIGAPIQVYPLYENGFRAHRRQYPEDNHAESARLYADFAQVAAQHEYAWSHGKRPETASTIATITKRNRMICQPYPLLMNAFNTVNLSAAVLLTSVSTARSLSIPESKWIYPLSGAGTSESASFWQRPNYHSSRAISASLDAALSTAGLRKTDIDLFDFYSCFPIVPKLACAHLDLPLFDGAKPITLLGGLTSFGGAGNNYSMHALTEMVRRLRSSTPATNGLVLANGGVLTYQHVVVLSSSPRRQGAYPSSAPLPEMLDLPSMRVLDEVEGEAEIETYTVDYARDGRPVLGHVVGRMKRNGARFLANHGDQRALQALCELREEVVGRAVYVRRAKDGKRNEVFVDSLVSRL